MSNPTSPEATPQSTFEISLEDIDSILDQEDPEFNKQLEGMSADQDLGAAANLESLSVNADVLVTEDLKEAREKALSARFPKLFKLLTPFKKLRELIKAKMLSARNQLLLLITRSISYLRNEFPERVKYLFSLLKSAIANLFKGIGYVLAMPLKTKVIVGLMLALIVGGGFLLVSAVKGKFYFGWQDNMLRDFSTLADKSFKMQSGEKWEKIYSAFPQPEYSVLLDKIVVNLVRHSANSNPMSAFKVFLTTDSQSTAVEVKDREKEIIDLFARVAEEFTYEEMISIEGKDRFKTKLMDAANQVLNQGEVSQIHLETLILKP